MCARSGISGQSALPVSVSQHWGTPPESQPAQKRPSGDRPSTPSTLLISFCTCPFLLSRTWIFWPSPTVIIVRPLAEKIGKRVRGPRSIGISLAGTNFPVCAFHQIGEAPGALERAKKYSPSGVKQNVVGSTSFARSPVQTGVPLLAFQDLGVSSTNATTSLPVGANRGGWM